LTNNNNSVIVRGSFWEEMVVTDVHDMEPRIAAWSRATHGERAGVSGARSLGGHSGVTIGFDVVVSGDTVERLVLKMPPAGVIRQNNFDVMRQVPVLRAMAKHDILAPQARYWSEDEGLFGAPYLMMSRLQGSSMPDLFGPDAGKGVVDAERQFAEAIETLAQIHAIDPAELADWDAVRLAAAEIDHWVKVLKKSDDPEWIRKGMAVREQLKRSMPREIPFGIVHGDFYTNNWIFDDGRFTGVVDWEGASLGPKLIDLGWVCMMYDAAGWGPTRRATMGWHPGPEAFIAHYARHTGADLSDMAWYRALAAYRLACITAYYLERHRSGKRHNPIWEVFGESFPYLLDRAAALLNARAAAA
jgi:aminoglycoside phosphotransferase (APT) family kinase protein